MSTVMLVSIDGLRPDALAQAPCPNLQGLLRRGAYSLSAKSVMPSITLPCHMSIFHSVPPTRHGVTTNDWQPMARPLPGLVDVAAQEGLHCAFFYNWEQLRNLSQPGRLEFSYCWNIAEKDVASADQRVADAAASYIAVHHPDFAFVYLGTVDTIGHRYGWMSEEYLTQVGVADQALGAVLSALPDQSTVLVQSDHGGHDRSHGTELPEDMQIPWIVAGPGVRAGHAVSEAVSLLDTTPTLAHTLKLRPHRDWEGRIVAEAFAQ